MPRPYGRDRLEALPGGRIAVLCREPKGWKGRQGAPEFHHRADHPGTAVLWEDAHWEVLEVEWRPDGVFRYVLAPWNETNVFRGMVRYDEETEAARVEVRRQEQRATAQRTVLVVLAPLAGLLPEDDQLRLESRLAVPAGRMTFLSALAGLLLGTYCVISLIAASLGGGADPATTAVLLVGNYLFVESFARLVVVMSQGRPVGSLLVFPWLVVKAIREPKAPDLGHPPDARDRDWERHRTYHALQPVLALLPEEDQRYLLSAFEFDPLSWGRTTALAIGGVGLLFAGSAVMNLLAGLGGWTELLWLGLGLALLAEQRGRLARIRSGRPAGSVFGRWVRPFARSILPPSVQAAAGAP